MKIFCFPQASSRESADALVIPLWEGQKDAGFADYADTLAPIFRSSDFKGTCGETMLVYPQEAKESKVLLVGLGNKEKVSLEVLRKASGAAVKAMRRVKAKHINFVFPPHISLPREDAIRAVIQGLLLSNYAYDRLKGDTLKKAHPLLESLNFIGLGASHEAMIKELQTIIDGVHFARDLVSGNADDVTPAFLAQEAMKFGKISKKIKVSIHDRKWLEKEKMGLILAVGRAAEVDPVLIEVAYKGDPSSKETTVLVGKGVTYDTGGLSLKPTSGMLDMKCDMGGSATVLATMRTLATLGLKVNVTALVPSVESSIDAKSYKLGDVYRAYSGKTVEINNTDAEGRLILADALAYAVKHLNPSYLIDLATLTGAVVVALGDRFAGFCSNDDELAKDLRKASTKTADGLWQLPLVEEYLEKYKSEVADLTNSAGRDAGSITAALFLKEFIGSTKWAHIDIAGTSYLSKPRDYHPTKATGYGVELLIEFFKNQCE